MSDRSTTVGFIGMGMMGGGMAKMAKKKMMRGGMAKKKK